MVLDISSIPDSSSPSSSDDDELTMDLDTSRRRRHQKSLGKLHISHLLQMVLQDAQTRLFFKAQSVIQSEIRYFVPKGEDLAYPDKLVGEWIIALLVADGYLTKLVAASKPITGYEIKEKESVSQLFQLSSLNKKETWYPTLQKTVWVLSQLHDFVKVFFSGMTWPSLKNNLGPCCISQPFSKILLKKLSHSVDSLSSTRLKLSSYDIHQKVSSMDNYSSSGTC
jgi:hypothetical protein